MSAHTDGACRGNPGPGGIGFTIEREGKVIEENYQFIGESTNNIAEYTAVILALSRMIELGTKTADIFSDSELIVKQINGLYKVKNEGLLPLHSKVKQLRSNFKNVTFTYIPRESNRAADRLANTAIDRKETNRKLIEDQSGKLNI